MVTSVPNSIPITSDRWNNVVMLHARIENALALELQQQHQLGLSEFRALRAIAHHPAGELRLQEIAEVLNLNQSSVSRLVSRLEAVSLTVRDICADDRRGVYSVITETGRSRIAEAEPTYDRVLVESLAEARSDARFSDLVESMNLATV
jgi:DNA-binding MarR family transcriptional regulator